MLNCYVIGGNYKGTTFIHTHVSFELVYQNPIRFLSFQDFTTKTIDNSLVISFKTFNLRN